MVLSSIARFNLLASDLLSPLYQQEYARLDLMTRFSTLSRNSTNRI